MMIYAGQDPLGDYETIQQELKNFSSEAMADLFEHFA